MISDLAHGKVLDSADALTRAPTAEAWLLPGSLLLLGQHASLAQVEMR